MVTMLDDKQAQKKVMDSWQCISKILECSETPVVECSGIRVLLIISTKHSTKFKNQWLGWKQYFLAPTEVHVQQVTDGHFEMTKSPTIAEMIIRFFDSGIDQISKL